MTTDYNPAINDVVESVSTMRDADKIPYDVKLQGIIKNKIGNEIIIKITKQLSHHNIFTIPTGQTIKIDCDNITKHIGSTQTE